jgi:hypothetical protein
MGFCKRCGRVAVIGFTCICAGLLSWHGDLPHNHEKGQSPWSVIRVSAVSTGTNSTSTSTATVSGTPTWIVRKPSG